MKPKKDLNYSLLKEIETRWSGRAFSNQDLKKETILQLIEAARWSPSSYNAQPWHFKIAVKGTRSFDLMLESLTESNQVWAKNSGALILTEAILNLRGSEKQNKYAFYDLGAAVAFLSLEAEKLGLNIHQMGGFDSKRAEQNFPIEEGSAYACVIAIGYRGESNSLNDELRSREVAGQQRKGLDEILRFED